MGIQLMECGGRCYTAAPLLIDEHDPPLVIYATGSRVHLVSLKSGQLIATYEKHSHTVIQLIHDDKEHSITSVSEDGYISVWNVDTLEEIKAFQVAFPIFDLVLIASKINSIGIVMRRSVAMTTELKESSNRIQDEYLLAQYDISANEISKPLSSLKYPTHCISQLLIPDEYLVAVNRKEVNFFAIESDFRILFRTELNDMNCLAINPHKYILATGHGSGAITLWYDIHSWLRSIPISSFNSQTIQWKSKPIHTIVHWHALPLYTLCFNPDGNFLYSGGEEGVLVQWQLNNSHKKTFLPRLGAPIASSCSSKSTNATVICTTDNCIRIIDAAR